MNVTAKDSKSTPKKAEDAPRHPLALLESLLGSAESAAAARLEQMHGHLSTNHRASGYDGTAAQIHAQYAQALAPIVEALRAQAEAAADALAAPLDREPSTWDHRRTYTPGEQVWVVRFNVWHPAVIVRTDATDYIVRIPRLDQLITATSCMLRARAALAQAGGEPQ